MISLILLLRQHEPHSFNEKIILLSRIRMLFPEIYLIKNDMTNYFNLKLITDAEKNPGPTQNNTDSHETTIKPVMQSDSQ